MINYKVILVLETIKFFEVGKLGSDFCFSRKPLSSSEKFDFCKTYFQLQRHHDLINCLMTITLG